MCRQVFPSFAKSQVAGCLDQRGVSRHGEDEYWTRTVVETSGIRGHEAWPLT